MTLRIPTRSYPRAFGRDEEWPVVGGDIVDSTGAVVAATAAQIAAAIVGTGPEAALPSEVAVAADELAIPITHKYVAKTTGADAEALTLADGADDQVLIINLEVDGNGVGTLTPTTPNGFATIVFADAGDQAVLKFINTSGWTIIGLSGVAGPPAITL